MLFLLFSAQTISARNYHDGRIIVKFKNNPEILGIINQSGSIENWQDLLGKHSLKPYLSKNTIDALNIIRSNRRAIAPDVSQSLERIYYVIYSSKLTPEYVCRKLKTDPNIDYAEAAPIHTIDFLPNDPELTNQYHLPLIKAFEAWDSLMVNDTAIIGIVDTGVDYLHPDLAPNIYTNSGESGLDENGNDKSSNSIDDDGNGYVDDWRGWDFVSSSLEGYDNDPYPGSSHGTHVAGISAGVVNNAIGIAGVAIQSKILPVKIGSDDPGSRSVDNSYEGLLFAAISGAHVINCSWGSTGKSRAEEEIINTALSLGSIIVAAAGNDNTYTDFYPASYKGVLSVASSDSEDRKSSFSNYSGSVGVSAPGSFIYSTIPGAEYSYMSGTSMASPVAAGLAALVRLKYPTYSQKQAIEHIKATSDNINEKNPFYLGKIGKGRVNAFRALTEKNPRSLQLTNTTIHDESNDGVLDIGERIEIEIELTNHLNPINDIQVEILFLDNISPEIIDSVSVIGNLASSESRWGDKPFKFILPNNIPPDYTTDLTLRITASDNLVSYESIRITLNPSYRDLNANNIRTTVNSIGNFAFNDYPDNAQGIGFSYKTKSDLLYEGSLMIGSSYSKISNVARGSSQSYKDRDFFPSQLLSLDSSGQISKLRAYTEFKDDNDSLTAGVKVNQTLHQFNSPGDEDFILAIYDVINISDSFFDSLYVGLYFDWDLGPQGSYNQADFDTLLKYGSIRNTINDSLPFVGIAMLSNFNLNYWAIDNDGTSADNPGVWDGFTPKEKWRFLTSRLDRMQSGITDASNVISAGPITLRKGDTTRIVFSIFAADNKVSLDKAFLKSQSKAINMKLNTIPYQSIPDFVSISNIYPNPANDLINIELAIKERSDISIDIFDYLGKKIKPIYSAQSISPGYHRLSGTISDLSQGNYFIRMNANGVINYYFLSISRN